MGDFHTFIYTMGYLPQKHKATMTEFAFGRCSVRNAGEIELQWLKIFFILRFCCFTVFHVRQYRVPPFNTVFPLPFRVRVAGIQC